MRRRTLLSSMGGGVDPSEALACDICFAHRKGGETDLVIITNEQWNSGGTKKYPASEWTPVGIVVVPGTHGVLKDGTGSVNQCGIMSLVPMSYSTPASGGNDEQATDVFMYWSSYSANLGGRRDGLGRYDSVTANLQNYLHVVTTNGIDSNDAYTYSAGHYASLPTQQTVGGTILRYGNETYIAPSPYIGSDYKSGGYNPSYGLKDGVVGTETNNALSDFKGIVNTKIITDSVTVSNWKTASSIANSYGDGNFPAACCCARFKTTGTKAFVECTTEELRNGTGFWYLPAAGELGYIMPRFADINDTISKLNSAYGVGVQLLNTKFIWTSTLGTASNTYTIDFEEASRMEANYKQGNYKVRSFLRL